MKKIKSKTATKETLLPLLFVSFQLLVLNANWKSFLLIERPFLCQPDNCRKAIIYLIDWMVGNKKDWVPTNAYVQMKGCNTLEIKFRGDFLMVFKLQFDNIHIPYKN